MNEKVEISVIMPAYNEEKLIEECFHRVVATLERHERTFEIILEEDGSTDRTPQIIDALASRHPFVKVLHFRKRMGKGFGVRMGIRASEGEYVVVIDSDMEYPPEGIPDLLGKIDSADIVVGSRMNWKNYKTRIWRRLSSIIFILVLRILFGLDGLCDPQSGFKAYRRRVIKDTFPLTSNGFEVDTEIIIKAIARGYKLKHIPITYTYKGNSKVDMLRDPLRMLLSALRWKINGMLETREEGKPTEEYLPYRMRKNLDDEAFKFDQAEIGYESKNPLVRLFFDRKIEVILRHSSDEKNRCVLDVGCGDGLLLEKIRGEFAVGLDLSLTRLKRARSRAKKRFFICGDAEHLPFRESAFDLVTCLDTLEHLPDPLNCVRDLEFSTAKGGTILVSVPDDRWLTFARFLTVRRPFCLRGHGHIHSLEPREVVKLFKNSRLASSLKVPTSLLPIITFLCMKNDGESLQTDG